VISVIASLGDKLVCTVNCVVGMVRVLWIRAVEDPPLKHIIRPLRDVMHGKGLRQKAQDGVGKPQLGGLTRLGLGYGG
jgi:hypothetical protein